MTVPTQNRYTELQSLMPGGLSKPLHKNYRTTRTTLESHGQNIPLTRVASPQTAAARNGVLLLASLNTNNGAQCPVPVRSIAQSRESSGAVPSLRTSGGGSVTNP